MTYYVTYIDDSNNVNVSFGGHLFSLGDEIIKSETICYHGDVTLEGMKKVFEDRISAVFNYIM